MHLTEFVNLAKDEKIIKEYEAAKMTSPYKLIVNIALTTKRVMFYGKESGNINKNQLLDEVHINKVIGTEIFKGRRPNFIQLIIGIIISLFSIGLLIDLSGRASSAATEASWYAASYAPSMEEWFIAIIVLIVGIVIIILSIKSEFHIVIKAENTDSIVVGKERSSVIKPAEDVEALMKELGAMILDIQLHGEGLLEKTEEESEEEYGM